MTYVINPEDGAVLRREFGLATITFWSESACYTSVSEQIIRSILDLPLGDARMIDYEEYYLEEEIEVPEDQIKVIRRCTSILYSTRLPFCIHKNCLDLRTPILPQF